MDGWYLGVVLACCNLGFLQSKSWLVGTTSIAFQRDLKGVKVIYQDEQCILPLAPSLRMIRTLLIPRECELKCPRLG